VSRASSRNSLGGTAASSAAAAAAASTGNVQSPPANVTAKETSDSQESTPSPAVSEQQAAQNRNFDTCQKCGKSEPKRGSGHKSNFLTCKGCMQKCKYISVLHFTIEKRISILLKSWYQIFKKGYDGKIGF